MPVRLGHWQSQTSSVCSGMTGQWSDRTAMSSRKTLSISGPLSYLCGLALRIWTSFWRREGSAGMDIWNAAVVQSRQPVIQVDGKHGPGRDCREQTLSAIGPYDKHTWRSGVRYAMNAASQLSGMGGAHWCGCCACTCTLIKNLMMMMISAEKYWSLFLFLHEYMLLVLIRRAS